MSAREKHALAWRPICRNIVIHGPIDYKRWQKHLFFHPASASERRPDPANILAFPGYSPEPECEQERVELARWIG